MQDGPLDHTLKAQCRLCLAVMVFRDDRGVLFDEAGQFKA